MEIMKIGEIKEEDSYLLQETSEDSSKMETHLGWTMHNKLDISASWRPLSMFAMACFTNSLD